MIGSQWRERRDDPDVAALRDRLWATAGIRGLEVLEPDEVERATRILHRDGFVVVAGVLDPGELATLRAGCEEVVAEIVALDPDRTGNRGSHRYSFGASSITRSMLHRPEWRMLVDHPRITPIITAVFGSDDYSLRSAGGDFCLPGAVEYQPLHSDMGDFVDPERTPHSAFSDPRGFLTTRDLPLPYVCVNVLVVDSTPVNGPTRQIPGSQHSRAPIPTPEEEPEWMRLSTVCPAPAGSIMIRDVRAWHGGTPNVSDELRCIPNVEFYAPWFREPTRPGISRTDHLALSEHGRRVTRFHVLDSGLELDTGYRIGPTPGLRRADRRR